MSIDNIRAMIEEFDFIAQPKLINSTGPTFGIIYVFNCDYKFLGWITNDIERDELEVILTEYALKVFE